MAFFLKWKTNRHKKFQSEDNADETDCTLENSILKKSSSNSKKKRLNEILEESEDENKPLFASYNVKYLGCTPIDSKRSEKATSEAIKTVISNSKAGGRKSKTLKSIILNVSQDGVEILEQQSRQLIMRYSIYQISYCSVDAAHDHTFSFVSAEPDPLSDKEKLSCHVFQCTKRKISHEITLMVARCFESAYKHWRDTVLQSSLSKNNNFEQQNAVIANNPKNVASLNTPERCEDVTSQQTDKPKSDNLLIDLSVPDSNQNVMQFLQNSWVSFEDDFHETNPIVAC